MTIDELLAPHKYWRLNITENTGTVSQPSLYITINELQMFENADYSGNILTGATAVSNRATYGSQLPGLAIDGNETTFWEAGGPAVSETSPTHLTITLPTPKSLRSFKILSKQYPRERPKHFLIEFSDDGVEWKKYYSIRNAFVTDAPINIDSNNRYSFTTRNKLAGTVYTNDNTPTKVTILRWLGEATRLAENQGYFIDMNNWVFFAADSGPFMVLYISDNGLTRPQADGPITASLT